MLLHERNVGYIVNFDIVLHHFNLLWFKIHFYALHFKNKLSASQSCNYFVTIFFMYAQEMLSIERCSTKMYNEFIILEMLVSIRYFLNNELINLLSKSFWKKCFFPEYSFFLVFYERIVTTMSCCSDRFWKTVHIVLIPITIRCAEEGVLISMM